MVQKGNGPRQKLEGKQEGKGENKEKGRRRNAETRATTNPATTLGVAEEATIASAGDNGACSNGRDREDKCGGGQRAGVRTECGCSSEKGPLCNRGR